MRKSYTQVKTEDGYKLVPTEEAHLHRENKSAMVIGDIQPYRSPIDGEMITSRSHHRAHMQKHGVIEVGNEKLTRPARKPYSDAGLKDDIQRALYQSTR
jgi:hypothetical protein